MVEYKYNIGFRVDGSPDIGLGHIMRCLALADEFKYRGYKVFFISNEEHDIITNKNYIVIKIPSNAKKSIGNKNLNLINEKDFIGNIIQQLQLDCLIVDHYQASLEYLTFLKNKLKILVLIDDFCMNGVPVDIIINGNIFSKKSYYSNVNESTILLLGSKYILFRAEFLNLAKRVVNLNVKEVLITTGGSDNHNLTLRLLRILKTNSYSSNLKYNVIIGCMFRNEKEIENYAERFDNIELFYNISNMCELMMKSDITLSTSGGTLYELAITGTPSISFIVAENQENLAKKMNELECTINLGWHNNVSDEMIKNKLNSLIKNLDIRKKISQIGQTLFDGKGAYRVAQVILDAFKRK